MPLSYRAGVQILVKNVSKKVNIEEFSGNVCGQFCANQKGQAKCLPLALALGTGLTAEKLVAYTPRGKDGS